MADTNSEDQEHAAREFDTGPAATLDGALGPNWQAWQDHVAAHVTLPDSDDDEAELSTPVVPMLVYGDGPNDYIATSIGDGQVVVQDGNDPTGKAWKFPQATFMRFVAHAQGRQLDDEAGTPAGDNPLVAAAKQNARTGKLIQADRDAAAEAEKTGRSQARR